MLELDNGAQPAEGALAYFYTGGTTTPLSVYEDADETTPHAFPLEADGNGRWPLVVIPFIDSYDVKVTTSGGTQLYYFRELPNPDPVDASASIDTTKIAQTGDLKFSPKSGTVTGWVRCNGRTIGNATSGATERANADTSDLYAFLWNNFADSILPVATGRGGTAAADFAASKAITLFDLRGGAPIGLDDMGASAASRFGSVPFGTGNATTGGSFAGENVHILSEAELASHTHAINISTLGETTGHTHVGTTGAGSSHNHGVGGLTGSQTIGTISIQTEGVQEGTKTLEVFCPSGNDGASSGGITLPSGHQHSMDAEASHTHSYDTSTATTTGHVHGINDSTSSKGSGTAHNIVSLAVLGNWLIRL